MVRAHPWSGWGRTFESSSAHHFSRGIRSAGRAPDLHSGGQRFDPAILHQFWHFKLFQIVNINYQYLYPIVRIDEQSINVRIDEHFFKNLIYTENYFLCINQAFKGVWRMPRHWKAKKDVVYCDKFRGAVCGLWSENFRMGQPITLCDTSFWIHKVWRANPENWNI